MNAAPTMGARCVRPAALSWLPGMGDPRFRMETGNDQSTTDYLLFFFSFFSARFSFKVLLGFFFSFFF
jgi:hypothetical protein